MKSREGHDLGLGDYDIAVLVEVFKEIWREGRWGGHDLVSLAAAGREGNSGDK